MQLPRFVKGVYDVNNSTSPCASGLGSRKSPLRSFLKRVCRLNYFIQALSYLFSEHLVNFYDTTD